MPIQVPRGHTDPTLDQMILALQAYETDHPQARIAIYRQNQVSVRMRNIAPDFAGRSKVERSKGVWKYLDALDDDAQADLSTLILLTPAEVQMSFANREFDDPIASRL